MKKSLVMVMVIFTILSLTILVGCSEPAVPSIGIQSIDKTGTNGLVDTYTITFTNGSSSTFTINNGENGHTPVIEIGENGNWFVDGTDTFVQAQAKDGKAGLSAYELYKKYHPEYQGSEEDWVNGLYSEPAQVNEIVSVEKTDTKGLVDTYTITFSNGSTSTFTINNGENGHTPTIKIGKNGNWFIDGIDTKIQAQATSGEAGLSAYELYKKYHPEYQGSEEEWANGLYPQPNEIVSIEKTKTEGLVDTYTITFTNGSSSTFTINNGENGHTPIIEIGENGNWFIDGIDTEIQAQSTDGEAGLSAYELYIKYHPEYEGSEEEWVNEFFHNENDLELFVRQMDVLSYTAELREYHDGVLANDQVFEKSEDIRYWKKIYNEYDNETGDYYPYLVEYYYETDNDDATNPDYILSLIQRDNAWYMSDDEYDIYTSLNQCYMRYYQYLIDPAQFDQVTSTYYKAKADYVTEVGKAFFYDRDAEHWGMLNGVYTKVWRTEIFHTFELEIVSGNLKVRATSTIEDGDDITEMIYELVLSKMGVTSLTIPEYMEYPEAGFPCDYISDCYEKSQGEEVVNLYGVVTGYIPVNDNEYKVWITDFEERDILVIFKGFGYPYGIEIGRDIVVYGKIDIVDGLRSIVVTRRIDYELYGSSEITNPNIQDLSGITDYDSSRVVNLESVSFDNVKLDGEGTIFLTDHSGHTLELWVSQNEVDFFNDMCTHLSASDEYNLNNIAITSYNSGLCARLTKQSEVVLEYGVLLSYSNKLIKESLTVEDALDDLVVHYRGSDYQYVLLDKSDYTFECEDYDSSQNGTYDVIVTYGEETAIVKLIVYLPEIIEHVSYDTLQVTAEKKLNGITPSLPSTGDVNILVIPLGFTNTDYDKYGTEDEIKARLEIAFNDTEGKTGWYSLKEYYQAASYGNLNINANILDIYQTGEAYDLYSGNYDTDDIRYILGALEYFDDEVDYSLYDQNDDWYIDCIYFVYLAPYFDYTNPEQSDMWWAYFSYSMDYEEFDDTYLYGFLWMSYEFFDEPIDIIYSGLDEIDTENSLYVNINCETVIHETGHALGLDDYYDYLDGGVKGGVGYFAMMDANEGDHDPYSKAILGWTSPTVVVDMDYETTLRSFEATGDTIILSKTNGETYFDEYYMIAFYTPTGVNELKSDRDCGLPSVSGVMVWHIDAVLRSKTELWRINTVVNMTKYNNGDGKYKLIDLVCGDGSTDIDKFVDYKVKDKDLFAAGSTISGLTWHDGTDVGVEIAVGTFVNDNGIEQVTITIDY